VTTRTNPTWRSPVVTTDDVAGGSARWTIHDAPSPRPGDPPDFSWSPTSSAATSFFDRDSVPEELEVPDGTLSRGSDDDPGVAHSVYRDSPLAEESSDSASFLGSSISSDPDDSEDIRFERLSERLFERLSERLSADSFSATATLPPTAERATTDELVRFREDGPRKGLAHNPLPAIVVGLILATVFGLAGAVSSFRGKTVYTSTTVMLINDPYQLATSGSSEFVDLDALRSKYAGLLGTDPIAQPVAASLHLSLDSVVGAVSAEVPTQSLLMQVEATWQTPTEAELVSQTAANQLTSYVNAENVRYNIPANDQISLTTVNPASPAVARRPSKSHALTLAVGLAVLGFALGFFSVQLVRYLR
jgi:capsular polysaccharide biosynthesis protein